MVAEQKPEEQRSLVLPGLPYLQDVLGVCANVVADQFSRMNGILQRMGSGKYKPEDLFADTAWLATEWLRDAAQIGAAYQSSVVADALPTVGFVLDGTAEAADPKETPITTRIGKTTKIAVTPLTRVPQGGEIGPEKVQAALSDRRDRLRVTLADIGGLAAGHYLGWVYVDAKGDKKPLAAVHVVKFEAGGRGGETRAAARRTKAKKRR